MPYIYDIQLHAKCVPRVFQPIIFFSLNLTFRRTIEIIFFPPDCIFAVVPEFLKAATFFTQNFAGDKIEENEMGWACGEYG